MNKTSASATSLIEFEPEFISALKTLFEEKIVFNQALGLKVVSVRPDGVTGRIDMKPGLVGHYAYNRIHGGVVSAGLDAMAGLAIMAAIGARHMDETPMQRMQRFSKLGTIDLRVDLFRGEWSAPRPSRASRKLARADRGVGVPTLPNDLVARVESIKAFRLIDTLLTAEDEELTPTMKLKRRPIGDKYAAAIEAMYAG